MKEGITNLYQYSKAFDGTFAQSLDCCATSFQYLKNSIAAMVSPLINALSPAIDFIIDKFVALLNIKSIICKIVGGFLLGTKAKNKPHNMAARKRCRFRRNQSGKGDKGCYIRD
jgi:hypothetical protein